jgi:hypothetical protein
MHAFPGRRLYRVANAIGTAYVSKALLPPKVEQVFYAAYLAMIAGFYLAFTVYFGSEQAWRVESTAVLCFALIGLAGIRVPFALIAGYLLHGLWDVMSFMRTQDFRSSSLDRRLRFRSPMVSSAPRMTPAWQDTSSPGALIGMTPGLQPTLARNALR